MLETCKMQAIQTLMLATDLTEEMAWVKYIREPKFNAVVDHLAEMYYIIMTNESFQLEQEKVRYQTNILYYLLKKGFH